MAAFPGQPKLKTANYDNDVFVAKYDAAGKCVWAKQAGGLQSDDGYGIAVDRSSNIYVTGGFNGSARFGTAAPLTSRGNSDIFVAKYSPAGAPLWAKSAGGTLDDGGRGIAVDDKGISYVTGYFSGVATFDSLTLTSRGQDDLFVAKYDANGRPLWAKAEGQKLADMGSSIAVDGAGNSYVTGYKTDDPMFSGQLRSPYDTFVTKYDSDGNVSWKQESEAGGDWDEGNGIAVDASGNCYVTGTFQSKPPSQLIFDAFKLTNAGDQDIFVAKLDSKTPKPPTPGSTLFFTRGKVSGPPAQTDAVALGDLNNDGYLDAFVCNVAGSGYLPEVVMLNRGNGDLIEGQTLHKFNKLGQEIPSISLKVVLADVENDGDLDAFVANFRKQTPDLWLNNGDGTFTAGQDFDSTDYLAIGIALGDFNKDGYVDAVFVYGDSRNRRVFLNDGKGTFKFHAALKPRNINGDRDVEVADLNGDGQLDIFVMVSGIYESLEKSVHEVYFNDGAGNFTISQQTDLLPLTPECTDIQLGDLDGDGDIDVVEANLKRPNKIWLNDGKGMFSSPPYPTSPGSLHRTFGTPTTHLALADVDSDGDLDVVQGAGDQPIWLNDGTGFFKNALTPGANFTGPLAVAVGDFNNDGAPDVFQGGGTAYASNTNKVWLARSPVKAKDPTSWGKKWGFTLTNGPAMWGKLDTTYLQCRTGKQQTPVNIEPKAIKFGASLPDLKFAYNSSAAFNFEHVGYTLEAHADKTNSRITIGGKTYELLQFHFHTQSEHTVLREALPIEMHLVHRAADGSLAVVGVFIVPGTEHAELKKIWSPSLKKYHDKVSATGFDLNKLLPSARKTLRYDGSLTTPDCQQNLAWNLFVEPIEMSREQIRMFQKLFSGKDFPNGNRRPAQLLNGRSLSTDLQQSDLPAFYRRMLGRRF